MIFRYYGKFITADPRHDVGFTEGAAQVTGKAPDQFIAGLMAMLIIGFFQVILSLHCASVFALVNVLFDLLYM